uniref:Deltameth_res domain-containing protein n=1 Tax=Heterorhabditis bacteriophora TaxID=37862 RepID=A0A1I7W7K5_HETBA
MKNIGSLHFSYYSSRRSLAALPQEPCLLITLLRSKSPSGGTSGYSEKERPFPSITNRNYSCGVSPLPPQTPHASNRSDDPMMSSQPTIWQKFIVKNSVGVILLTALLLAAWHGDPSAILHKKREPEDRERHTTSH